MPIARSKQDWTVGATVRVGFLSLVVIALVATPGDFKPDAYVLSNAAGTKFYRFVPHNGLTGGYESAEAAAEDRP